MLSPPLQEHLLGSLESGGPSQRGACHRNRLLCKFPIPDNFGLQPDWKGILYFASSTSMNALYCQRYPLLQKAILVTLAHSNLSSVLLQHQPPGWTTEHSLDCHCYSRYSLFLSHRHASASAVSPMMFTPPLAISTCSSNSLPVSFP